jgi:hypothetical protein
VTSWRSQPAKAWTFSGPSADSIRKVLRGMHQAVIGTAELRNRFGTGHGRHRRSSGLGPRHARLVASAALGLTRFLLETRAERRARDQAYAA